MSKLITRVKNFFGKKEEGATMVEYAIMVALIAIVSIATVTLLGTEVNRVFEEVRAALNAV